MSTRFLAIAIHLLLTAALMAADTPAFNRTEDVVYGRKYGTALTLDVFTPEGPRNGAGVIFVVSGGWYSSHEGINPVFFAEYLRRGYTVFTVVHGSQPKFTIPEILEDMHRSVRFIRHNADRFGIDPDRLAITGGSAGGHLSLMIATAGKPGPADAKDPVDRESSRVKAVGCFFPPTDFLNYRDPGRDIFKALKEELAAFRAPFDFRELDKESRRLLIVRGRQQRLAIAREISPVTHVTPDDPPTLILHGDADKLVPIQQAEVMRDRLVSAGVPVELVVRKGQGHGWPNWLDDIKLIADWFDRHLGTSPTTAPAK